MLHMMDGAKEKIEKLHAELTPQAWESLVAQLHYLAEYGCHDDQPGCWPRCVVLLSEYSGGCGEKAFGVGWMFKSASESGAGDFLAGGTVTVCGEIFPHLNAAYDGRHIRSRLQDYGYSSYMTGGLVYFENSDNYSVHT